MFKILDGRNHFYQWDLDRFLIVEDESIEQVHFCNRTDDCALVCAVEDYRDLRIVQVPNVLLQDNWRIRVYGYDGQATLHEATFNVKPRSKPEDYIYTDEEIHRWEELEARLEQIEENGVSDEQIATAVNSYLEANPVEIPVESVNGKVGAVELTAADVGALPDTTEIPSIEGLATEEYVDTAISNIDIPEVDLTDYATKEYVGQEIAEAQLGQGDIDLSSYYTKSETDAAIKSAVDAIEIPEPEEVDLSNYYTKTETDSAIDKKIAAIPAVDLSDYALKSEIPSTTGLATETYVDEKFNSIDIPDVDLSNYYTKSEVDGLIPDTSGFTTMSEVEAKGYQTETQVNTLINTALGVIENGTY